MKDFDATDLSAKTPRMRPHAGSTASGWSVVYLHCTAGTGRSPTVAIAYLYRRRGWDLDEASAYVTQRRQCSPNMEAILAANWGHANEEAECPCVSPEPS